MKTFLVLMLVGVLGVLAESSSVSIAQAAEGGGVIDLGQFSELQPGSLLTVSETSGETSTNTQTGYLQRIYIFFLGLVGVSAFFMITWGGFQYSTSMGNPSAISAAKDKIWGALIGIFLAATSFLILRTINPDLLNLDVNPIKNTTPAQNKPTSCQYDANRCAVNPNLPECAACK